MLPLLVTECVGWIDPRRLSRRRVAGQKRRREQRGNRQRRRARIAGRHLEEKRFDET